MRREGGHLLCDLKVNNFLGGVPSKIMQGREGLARALPKVIDETHLALLDVCRIREKGSQQLGIRVRPNPGSRNLP